MVWRSDESSRRVCYAIKGMASRFGIRVDNRRFRGWATLDHEGRGREKSSHPRGSRKACLILKRMYRKSCRRKLVSRREQIQE